MAGAPGAAPGPDQAHAWQQEEQAVLREHRSLHVKGLVDTVAEVVEGLREEQVAEITRRMELLFTGSNDALTIRQAHGHALQLAQDMKASRPLPHMPPMPQRGPPPRTAGLNLAVQKAAVLRFKELETNWTHSLPQDSRLRHVGLSYGELGFLLAGIKPCVLFAVNKEPSYAVKMTEFVTTIVDEFGLEREGFKLHVISHPLLTSNPVHPGFQGAAVFVNNNHDDFSRVRKVFLTPQPDPIPEVLIGRALGYPTKYGGDTVYYMNESECGKDGCKAHDSCMMLEYTIDERKESDFPAVMKHYQTYKRSFARQLGQVLTIDFRECPRLEAWWQTFEGAALVMAEKSF